MVDAPHASSPSTRKEQEFLTELERLGSPSSRRRSKHPNSLQEIKDVNAVREAERLDAETAESEVNNSIDKLGERQQHGKNIRSLIQKAAQKTILVVRTQNATLAAENVTIRFNKDRISDLPRSIVLSDICSKVLASSSFSSNRRRRLFYDVFETALECEPLLKDLFWYLTAHCFQSGRHKVMEERYYQRIADNFTSMFIRVQVQPASRDSGFFDMLPDVLAQILFMALYEAFPRSRKSMLNTDLRDQILHICYGWILGFVPAELDWSHWMPVDQDSPKRIAALTNFPAMRNRVLRAERIERTKLEMKNRQETVFDDDAGGNDAFAGDLDDAEHRERSRLPSVHTDQGHSGISLLQVQSHERCVYQMQNSPLVEAFLKSHQLEANSNHLKVQLRLTSGKHFDLTYQEALHATTQPRERRRRLVNTKSYAEVLDKIERFGDSVRSTYASDKKKLRVQNAAERRNLLNAQCALESRLSELSHQSAKLHEFSNLLVSKRRMDTHRPPQDSTQPQVRCQGLKPRPPPPRPACLTTHLIDLDASCS